jgi:hypothetical protein
MGNQNPHIEENRQHNGQRKRYKKTNNNLENMHIQLKIGLKQGVISGAPEV